MKILLIGKYPIIVENDSDMQSKDLKIVFDADYPIEMVDLISYGEYDTHKPYKVNDGEIVIENIKQGTYGIGVGFGIAQFSVVNLNGKLFTRRPLTTNYKERELLANCVCALAQELKEVKKELATIKDGYATE